MTAGDGVHALSAAEVRALEAAVGAAIEKHPGGPDGIRSLVEEVGEVANAMRRETPRHVASELLDVAVVAMRWRRQILEAEDILAPLRVTDGGGSGG